ncbi:hypothetical protein BH11PSE5_BH11PSE5_14210 [soil metagenome]|nr:hypothetical protein Sbs19_10290 [Sphingobium sp. BS19]CAH0352043.1 hypothetical protein SPH9361_01766 [Sphingobium sp. CECT 9361]
MLRKVMASVIGTRIAADTGKSSGVLGVAAGLLATRVIARSPLGALVLGGGYIAHKMLQKKREIDALGPHGAAVHDGLVEPGTPPLTDETTAPKALPAPTKAVRKRKPASKTA